VGDLKWFQRYQAVLKPVSMAQFFVVLVDDRSEVCVANMRRSMVGDTR